MKNKKTVVVSLSYSYYVIFTMFLLLLIPPIAFAIPRAINKCKESCEDVDVASSCFSDSDDDSTFTLNTLSGLSISSESSPTSLNYPSQEEMCRLLGPEVAEDSRKHILPDDFVGPKSLENTIKLDLPIGYRRLRRALLSQENSFWKKSILNYALHYKNVASNGWDHHSDIIGLPSLPKNMNYKDIIGASRKTEYTMPKTTLVRENVAFEMATITEYNEHCFAIDMVTSNPDVPFGKKFISHTKIVVYNKGENSSYMECSVEAEFPNGPPMGVAWQIKNAMKSGSIEKFKKIGDSILYCVT